MPMNFSFFFVFAESLSLCQSAYPTPLDDLEPK